ncbi:MAG TPA: RsmE family RNA methyltransferase [Gemmatimonadales bacterium]|nr:RsmE family RNA methyltransferase [Gemmatimonadales bacterium]
MITLLVQAGVLAPERQIQLDQSERQHLRVRRAQEAERVRLLDGFGGTAEGVVLGNPSDGLVQVSSVSTVPKPAFRGIAVAAGDRDRFGWLVEKSAELGITHVLPLETERTRGVGTRVRTPHIGKLQRRAFEGIKQSGSAWAPMVHEPMELELFVGREREGVRWLADFGGGVAPSIGATESAWTVIGPEGGFTPDERTRMLQAGWWPVKLGPHILRFETAALVAAVLMTSHDS